MDFCLSTAAYLPVTCARKGNSREILKTCSLLCFAKVHGFGTEPTKKGKGSNTKTPKENVHTSSEPSKAASGVLGKRTKNAQELAGTTSGKSNDPILDRQFLEKVESVRRSAYEKKKVEGERIFRPIDYDAPIESEQSKIGLATKVGVGVSVVIFGVVFAFGDFFPSGSNIPSGDNTMIEKKLSEKERSTLEETVRQFQETLSKSPQDPAALEIELLLGKAYSNWGHVSDAVAVYDQLISKYPNDFSGYLAKGIILKENGKVGDAERMFIQARFFAPEKAKAIVDRYSRQ